MKNRMNHALFWAITTCWLLLTSSSAYAVSGWTMTFTSGSAVVVGDTVTVGPGPAPCGKAVFSYDYTGELGNLSTLGFNVNLVSFPSPSSIYINIYLDTPPYGVFPTGRFFDVRLDYTFVAAVGANSMDTFGVSGGNARRNVSNPTPTAATVTTNYPLAQAISDYPDAIAGIALNFGDTNALGCGLQGTFIAATVIGIGPAPTTGFIDGRFVYTDGRINRFSLVAPIVVYPYTDANGDAGLKVYGVDGSNSQGYLIMVITPAMIATVPESPSENSLIASASEKQMRLYRLANGQFQFNAAMGNGKVYVLIFSEIRVGVDYLDYEIDPANL